MIKFLTVLHYFAILFFFTQVYAQQTFYQPQQEKNRNSQPNIRNTNFPSQTSRKENSQSDWTKNYLYQKDSRQINVNQRLQSNQGSVRILKNSTENSLKSTETSYYLKDSLTLNDDLTSKANQLNIKTVVENYKPQIQARILQQGGQRTSKTTSINMRQATISREPPPSYPSQPERPSVLSSSRNYSDRQDRTWGKDEERDPSSSTNTTTTQTPTETRRSLFFSGSIRPNSY